MRVSPKLLNVCFGAPKAKRSWASKTDSDVAGYTVLEGETVWSANKQAGLMLLVLSSLSCAMGFCVLCCGSTDPDSVAAGAKRLILENDCALLSCTPGSCYCRTTHNHSGIWAAFFQECQQRSCGQAPPRR